MPACSTILASASIALKVTAERVMTRTPVPECNHCQMQAEMELAEKLKNLDMELKNAQKNLHASQGEVLAEQGKLQEAVQKLESAQKQLREEEASSQVCINEQESKNVWYEQRVANESSEGVLPFKVLLSDRHQHFS